MIINGQSAANPLNTTVHEESSTTIPWEGSTSLNKMETAHFKFYSLSEKISQNKGIYGLYCVINTKLYVGSAINFQARLSRHLYYLNNNKHHSQKLQRAWNKYGNKSFKFVVIEELKNDLLQAEEKWIKYFDSYNNGFNCTDKCIDYKPFNLTSLQIQKRTEKSSKPIICLDLLGNFICEYPSLSKAAKSINDQTTNISSCCKKKLNYVKDFIFVYKTEYNPEMDYSYKPKDRIFSEVHRNNISKALKGRMKDKTKKQIDLLIQRSSKKVNQYNLDNILLRTYNSLKECCIENKLYIKTLKKHILCKTPLGEFLYELKENIV